MKKTIIIALGGSIIAPAEGKINTQFLKDFRKIILKYLKKNYRFIIITGGGRICRLYQKAAEKIIKLPYDDMDWLGIHATRLNAHLIRTIFRKQAYPVVLDDPFKLIKNDWQILVAAGWKPGWSTDYISVLLAKRFKVKQIIDAGNIPFVYTKDCFKHKDAQPIKQISWPKYRKLIGSKWIPGFSAPIDPIAAKTAQKLKLKAIIIKGDQLDNFESLLANKDFQGTIIG